MTRKEKVSEILEVLEKENVRSGFLFGIGGMDKGRIGIFNPEKQVYEPIEIDGFHEISNLSGNISLKDDGSIFLHIHITLGSKGKVLAGHLIEGYVRGTLEIVIFKFKEPLKRNIRTGKGKLILLDA